ncbi:MAG: 5-carboxymethyl-2-hydroxymuconate isomerase [Caldimonas sp.]
MPHVVVQYTANLDPDANIGALCKSLAEVIVAQRDAAGARLFPIGGTRVLAYPAPDFAVADGAPDRAFVYLNVRLAAGRERARVVATGEALMAVVRNHFASIFASRAIGITLQIDESAPVFDVKHSTLHPMFSGSVN